MRGIKTTYFLLSIIFIFVVSGCAPSDIGDGNNTPKTYETVIQKGVYYTLFVNSFADSNGDGYGDLQGVIDNLDYLNDGKGGGLGVKGIWLMPIFKSPTQHKYDTIDYYTIDERYGDLETFTVLVDECKERGITLLLDLVLNCTSSSHPWFKDALKSKESPYRDYYQFYSDLADPENYDLEETWWVSDTIPIWRNASNGEKFVGIYANSMPDLNFRSENLRKEVKSIAKYWLEKGVDGFRLDSAMHLFSNGELPKADGVTADFHKANIDWWDEFYDYCKTVNENTYLVGEVWTDTNVRAQYLSSLKSDFNFSVGGIVVNAAEGRYAADELGSKLNEVYDIYKEYAEDYIDAPFLTNHDMPRAATTLKSDTAKIKFAASVYLTLEGFPFMYYGEELGLIGAGDSNRKAFPWGEGNKYNVRFAKYEYDTLALDGQVDDEESVYNHYKRLIKVRNDYEELFDGRFEVFNVGGGLSSYKMKKGDKSALVIHNTSQSEIEHSFDISEYETVFVTEKDGFASSGGSITVKGFNTVILIKK